MRIVFQIVLCLTVLGAVLGIRYRSRQVPVNGYTPPESSWMSYGGAWNIDHGVIRNYSDERGAKLIGGSSSWRDYSVEADVALLGSYGDAGIIVRAQDPEEGVDSYTGYFAGLRTLDNTLLLGRSDFGWEEYKATPIPGNLQVLHFYHLHVIAVGCRIGVRVEMPGGRSVREGVELSRCVRSGRIGLKSYQTPAIWRDFRVRRATQADLDKLMDGVPLGSTRMGTLHGSAEPVNDLGPIRNEALNHRLEGNPTPIAQLRLLPSNGSTRASIRGAVRLLSPTTYVEDATGGIAVTSHDATSLALGDDVEITGTVLRSQGQLIMQHGHVKILWSSTPSSPPLITADQAATGAQDGRFVVLNGVLRRVWRERGSAVLEMESGGEVFRALSDASRYDRDLSGIKPGSELQIGGIVRSDQSVAGDSAFAILLSPAQNAVRVLQEPPWWTPAHIACVSLALLALITGGLWEYHRLRRRYLMNIVKERELLAHDLHDTISQSFAGIGFQLRAIQDMMPGDKAPLYQLERAQEMVRESHEELRRSITSLRTEVESISDLSTALEMCAHRLVQGGPLNIEVLCQGTPRRLPVRIADCFFRVGQEAISNAVLHSEASKLKVILRYEANRLTLQVADDGHGLRRDVPSNGSGLFGMAKRAEMVGAQLELTSGPHGTTVLLQISFLSPSHVLSGVLLSR